MYLCLFEYPTVAPDFESNRIGKEKAEFNLVAEGGFEPPTFGL